jgi:hypothetical protein
MLSSGQAVFCKKMNYPLKIRRYGALKVQLKVITTKATACNTPRTFCTTNPLLYSRPKSMFGSACYKLHNQSAMPSQTQTKKTAAHTIRWLLLCIGFFRQQQLRKTNTEISIYRLGNQTYLAHISGSMQKPIEGGLKLEPFQAKKSSLRFCFTSRPIAVKNNPRRTSHAIAKISTH